jgi:hypothetical protein
MWTGSCDRVHENDNDVTQAGREKVYQKLQQFWAEHVRLRTGDKTIMEVLYMNLVQRQA